MLHAYLLKVNTLSGEYLFVIAAIYLALLLAFERRWIASAAAFGSSVLWLSYQVPVAAYLRSLSTDSFMEAQQFDLDEARFWWLSLSEAIYPVLNPTKLVLYGLAAVGAFLAMRLMFRRLARLSRPAYLRVNVALVLALVGASVYKTAEDAIATYVANGEGFAAAARNFDQPTPMLRPPDGRLDLVVYIGESTTVMNMGLYGYARDTTPRLSHLQRNDDALLVFRNVLSTHAHTSQSLLEALSFGLDPTEDLLPIARRKRVSLPEALLSAGVDTHLVSNQGQRGAADQASTIVFRNSRATFRVAQELAAQRAGGAGPSRWDDEFFSAELARNGPVLRSSRITFLHSYAGHGPYIQHIPPAFRQPVDSLLSEMPRDRVASNGRSTVAELVETYDSTMRYVDYSVAQTLERVRKQPWPTVLVYFADHGESVFTGLAHDSAVFRHEMVRIPFLLFFNEAAQREYPARFARYQALARSGEIATLAQLPSTLLDLLGIDAKPKSHQSALVLTPLIGAPAALPPILVREQGAGITLLRLGAEPTPTLTPTGQRVAERVDEDTRLFLSTRSDLLPVDQACVQTPGSLEELSRRVLVRRCAPVADARQRLTLDPARIPARAGAALQ